jgi:hypothetical protein
VSQHPLWEWSYSYSEPSSRASIPPPFHFHSMPQYSQPPGKKRNNGTGQWPLLVTKNTPCSHQIREQTETSGSHGSKYEDDCLLGCCTVYSGRRLLTFQRCLLHPSSSPWCWRQQAPLEHRYTSFYQTTQCNNVEDSYLQENKLFGCWMVHRKKLHLKIFRFPTSFGCAGHWSRSIFLFFDAILQLRQTRNSWQISYHPRSLVMAQTWYSRNIEAALLYLLQGVETLLEPSMSALKRMVILSLFTFMPLQISPLKV